MSTMAHAEQQVAAAARPAGEAVPAPAPGLPRLTPPIDAASAFAAWDAVAPPTAKDGQPDDGLTPAERLRANLPVFEQLVTDLLARSGIPGFAVSVVIDDEVVFQQTYGVKAAGGTDPVGPHTLFQIGSTSKAFTATLLGTLVDEGVLSWDDPVSKWVPEWRLFDFWATYEFTVRDLLAHRSGLPPFASDELGVVFEYPFAKILEQLRYLPAVTPFRTAYAYQNITFAVAGEVAARATGTSYEQLVRDRILGPVGMHASTVTWDEMMANPDRVAGHLRGVEPPQPVPLPDLGYLTPAGGLASSITDMTRWLRTQLGGGVFQATRVVSSENLQVTHTPHTVMHEDGFQFSTYGLGWMIHARNGHVTVEHPGDTSANGAEVWMVPDAGFGMVALANEDDKVVAMRYALGLALNDLAYTGHLQGDYYGVLDAYFRAARAGAANPVPYLPEGPGPDPNPPNPLEDYTGTFQNLYWGHVTVRAEDGTLILNFGDNPTDVPLEPYDGNLFRNPLDNSAIWFAEWEPGGFIGVHVGTVAMEGRPYPLFTRWRRRPGAEAGAARAPTRSATSVVPSRATASDS